MGCEVQDLGPQDPSDSRHRCPTPLPKSGPGCGHPGAHGTIYYTLKMPEIFIIKNEHCRQSRARAKEKPELRRRLTRVQPWCLACVPGPSHSKVRMQGSAASATSLLLTSICVLCPKHLCPEPSCDATTQNVRIPLQALLDAAGEAAWRLSHVHRCPGSHHSLPQLSALLSKGMEPTLRGETVPTSTEKTDRQQTLLVSSAKICTEKSQEATYSNKLPVWKTTEQRRSRVTKPWAGETDPPGCRTC